jgi:hypothetical protein
MRRRILLTRLFVAFGTGLLWSAPAWAGNVSIGINIGTPPPPPPPIVVAAPPQLVVIPGTLVYYAPGVNVNYFVYKGKHYTFHDGAWFVASSHHGPWTFVAVEHVPRSVRGVPVSYYKVPPGHMKKAHGGPPPWAGKGKGKGPKHK